MLVHPEITPPDNFYHFRDTTLGMIGGFYAAWKIFSAVGFLDAVVTAGPAVLTAMGIMAVCQVSGVLIDIARSSRAMQARMDEQR